MHGDFLFFDIQNLLEINVEAGSSEEAEVKDITTVFVDTRLWKTKHPRKRFKNFRQSYVLSTCRIEIHQS